MEFFKSRQLSPQVSVIDEIGNVKCYLFSGTTSAVLVDTGSGFGNLKAYVDSLTSLPYTVICTHGHIDHAGGASLFDKVYLPAKDFTLQQEHCSFENKRIYANMTERLSGCTITNSDITPAQTKPFLPLEDGMEFDLGGLTLCMRALPGHTQGMTCVLLKEQRALLIGDACNPFTFMFFPYSSAIEEYRQTLATFQALYGHEFETLYLSHQKDTAPLSMIDECKNVCDEIIAGIDDAIPFNFEGIDCRIAKANQWPKGRLDGKIGNIVYHPNKIQNNKG